MVVEQAGVIEELRAEIVELKAEVVGLKAEVADLKRQLAGNSRNSSRPPSSDGLGKPAPKSLRERSGRKPGGQSGHGGGHLAKVQVPDEVVRHAPSVCGGCAKDLDDALVVGGQARQVFELPEIRLRVIEHQAERRRCSCGHETSGQFPAGVSAPAVYGPRFRALGIYLIARQHLPYDRAAQLLGDWLGAPVSTGTLAAFVARGAEDLQPFLDEIHTQITTAPVAHFDETGGRVDGRLRWLFTASTEKATLFWLHDKRGIDGLNAAGLLENFAGTGVHDGFRPYRRYTGWVHALCNAHHLRELVGVIEQHPDGGQSWATQMNQLLRDLHHAVKLAKSRGEEWLDPGEHAGYRAAYTQIIALGHRQNPPPTVRTGKRGPIAKSIPANLLHRLDRDREHVLRFAQNFQVPFDNNLAERDIRMVKLQQKISGGWRTITGAQQFLALRAYLSTARKQDQGIINVLGRLAERNPWIPAHPT